MDYETINQCRKIYDSLDNQLKSDFFATALLMATQEENTERETTINWMGSDFNITYYIDECETRAKVRTDLPTDGFHLEVVITTYDFNIYFWVDNEREYNPDGYIKEKTIPLKSFFDEDGNCHNAQEKLLEILSNHFGGDYLDYI